VTSLSLLLVRKSLGSVTACAATTSGERSDEAC
jgi:hypothetical protein